MMWKRWVAFVLCLCFLPVAALAEDAFRTAFHLSFSMNPDAYPESDYAVVKPLADILNLMTLEGHVQTQDTAFDLNADMLLNASERTRTSLRLYGDSTQWMLQSPLLGDETLSISMLPLLEFAIKAYSHLNIPLQRFAVLASPYVHQSSLEPLWEAAEPYITRAREEGILRFDELQALAASVSEAAANSREFTYWVKALLMESGYDDNVLDAVASLAEGIGTLLSEPTDVVIQTDMQSHSFERWKIGEQTIFEQVRVSEDWQRIRFYLPQSPLGIVTVIASLQKQGELLQINTIASIIGTNGEILLRLQLNGSLPRSLPLKQSFRLNWMAEGEMVNASSVRLLLEGHPHQNSITLRQLDASGERTRLAIHMQLSTEPIHDFPGWTRGGLDVITISSDELNALIRRIASPAIQGLLPVLAEIPSKTMQQFMDLLESLGIFAMLQDGFSSNGSEAENDADWDNEEDGGTNELDNSDAAYEIIW